MISVEDAIALGLVLANRCRPDRGVECTAYEPRSNDLNPTETAEPAGPMRVAEIWRYPVKSLAGELLPEADVSAEGLAGDRRLLIINERTGRLVTARSHPRLLALKATLGPDGEALIDGRPWDSPESAAAIVAAAGARARLIRWDGPERFDILPLLVATDGAIAAFGYDRRRLRPNIVIGGVPGLAERRWPGQRARIGAAVLAFAQLRDRCVMTTYDPDTQAQDNAVLRRIVADFDGKLALDTAVITGGRIAVGDAVSVEIR
jgi:uncharacterized protein YcbX